MNENVTSAALALFEIIKRNSYIYNRKICLGVEKGSQTQEALDGNLCLDSINNSRQGAVE